MLLGSGLDELAGRWMRSGRRCRNPDRRWMPGAGINAGGEGFF